MPDWWTWAGPILAALLGSATVIYLMNYMRGRSGRSEGRITVLDYGPEARMLALASLSIPVLCLISAIRIDDLLLRLVFSALCIVTAYVSIFASYLTCCVALAYDEKALYYRSPLRGGVLVSWSAISYFGYSDLMQLHYLTIGNQHTIWLSRSMYGFDDFASFACRRLAST